MICRILSLICGALASLCMILFFTFVAKADLAMDKSGMGDYPTFARYSDIAGYYFYAGIGLWAICLILAFFSPQPYKWRAISWFGLGFPLAAILGWLIYMSM